MVICLVYHASTQAEGNSMKSHHAFKDRIVVISGGGRGIGLAAAQAFKNAGAKVAIGDIDTALAESAAASLGGFGGYLDVRSLQSFIDFIAATEAELGTVDIIVNNAGIMPMGPMVEETAAISDAQIDINLRGVIHGIKAVLPGMLARKSGHIVNVASLAGRFPIPGAAVYCATKYAVVGLTASLREELRDSGIGVSVIMPSKVTTELSSGTGDTLPIPTVAPEDVAEAILAAISGNIGQVAVPRFMTSLSSLYGATPSWLDGRVRRLIGDDRILTGLDRKARKSYEDRVNAVADKPIV
jgi:NADP-dependent 3-hydroxy acid dehydrogenase YdfG